VLQVVDGRGGASPVPLSPTLRLTILRRVGFLPDRTLAELRAASILGSTFTLHALSVTTSRSALDLAAVLTPALEARVIEEDGDRLRFRHDLIRDAIYEDLPVTVRRGLHTEAGQRLAAAGASVAQVAEQLSRGAVPGDAQAIRWLTRAARQTAAGSPTVAAELLGRALELTAPGDVNAPMLRGEQATCLMWAGQVGDAEAICRSLLAQSPDKDAERVGRLCLGLALLVRGEATDAISELERAMASLPVDDRDRATALAWASVGRTWLGDLDGAAGAAETARQSAVASGNHHAVTVAMATSSVVASLRARLPEALQIADDAVRLADASPGREWHRYPIHAVRGFVLLELDRLDESRATVDAGMRISTELGVSWQTHTFQTVRVFERYIAGDWDDTLAEIEASGAFVDGSADPYARRLALSVLSMIRLHRNDTAGALATAHSAVNQPLAGQARYRTQWAPWAHALASEASGNNAAAYTELATVWDDCAELRRELE
jgi:tetratricopeptide (TPR) repeat protein